MKLSKVVLLSHQLNERTPLYAGDGRIRLKKANSIRKGNSCNTMYWSFCNHTGTHIDAPSHFIEGAKSISDLKAKDFIFSRIGLVSFKKIKPGYVVTKDDLTSVRDCQLLFLCTGFEDYRSKPDYWKDSVALSPGLAGWLKKKCPSLRALGIDSISISGLSDRESGRQAHRDFLGRGIFLIEDMKLSALRGKPDLVIVAPLIVEKADGSPCTVLAIYN